MSSSSVTVFSSYTIGAGASSFVDINLQDTKNAQFLLEMTYNATNSSTNGLTVRLKDGFGPLDKTNANLIQGPLWYGFSPGASPTVHFADNFDAVPGIPAFFLNYSSPQTIRYAFFLSSEPEKWPTWMRMEFINTDPSNPVTITLRAVV